MKWFLFVATMAFLTGCGGGGASNVAAPASSKVSGTVQLDGKPMAGGEVRFHAPGQPVKILEIKDGAFSGDVYPGNNRVEVLWQKNGPPNPMDKNLPPMVINTVAPEFSGIQSTLKQDVPVSGSTGLTFEVKSAKK
jgi:hypothetical protein